MKKCILFIAFTILSTTIALAQKKNKKAEKKRAKVEQSYLICEKTSRAERPILGVVDFNVTARGASRQIGKGMSDMLSNALVECKCFRIVERDRMSKIKAEQELKGIDQSTMSLTNQLVGAQLLVMGNITEFKEKSGGAGGILGTKIGRSIGVGGLGKVDAHVGMIIKVVHATTGEILVSKSLERKVTKVGGLGAGLFGIPIGGAFFKSKAMEDAIEETILEAVALIVEEKESLPEAVYNEPIPEMNKTTVTAYNTDFTSLMRLSKFLTGLSYVKKVDKTLNGSTAKIALSHTADTESLLIDLTKQMGALLEVAGFDDTSIKLKLK